MRFNIILDSSIMQKGVVATAGSRMLENFVSPIDATVALRLVAAGVNIDGRYDMTYNNPCNDHLLGTPDTVMLCNDYSGKISLAAAAKGLYYIHPTYGTVSRYGLIQKVSSMDQIGVLCKSPKVGFEVLKIIAGYDAKDGVMISNEQQLMYKKVSEKEVRFCFSYTEILQQVMQILCCAEIANNISRYDGIKIGYRTKEYNGLRELYTKSRTEAFGEDVKLAAIIGAMVLSQENYIRCYDKAMRLRRLIKQAYNFNDYDVITNDKGHRAIDDLGVKVATEKTCGDKDLLNISRLCGLPSLATSEGIYIAAAGREDILERICKGTDGDLL